MTFPLRVLLATNSRDRGSTSRMLEAWTEMMPAHGIHPVVSAGGRGPLFDALERRGVPTLIRPLDAIPSARRAVSFAVAILRLAAAIRQTRAQIVHLNEHDMYKVTSRAARLAGVPLVVHVHYRLHESYARWLFSAPHAPARLFFPSETNRRCSADALRGWFPPDRCRVILNGLDFERFGRDSAARSRLRGEWGLDDGTVAIGTACAISPIKRLDHFVRLIASVAAAGTPVRGFIAGGAHFSEHQRLVEELRQLATTLGVADRLTFLGYVEPSEPLFHAWDVYVSTSEYESFGMSMLEAMACGCAVVAYAAGAIDEVGGEAICAVTSGDEAALLRATARLCGDVEYRRKLADAGRQRAHRGFDIRRSVAELVQEYRDVVASPPPTNPS